MGTRGSTRLIAICLVTLVAMPQSIVSRLAAAEPMVRDTNSSRLVRIDMAAPLPRLVPIPSSPPPASPAPRALAGPAAPPLVAISYAPEPAQPSAPAVLTPLPIAAPAAPVYAAAPTPVTIPAPAAPPVYTPAPAPSYTPPPALAYAPFSLPPPLPVYVPPPTPAPQPLSVPAMPVSLAPPLPVPPQATLPPPLPQQAALPQPTVASAPAAVPPQPLASPQPATVGGKPSDSITIATFNIQVFGESKISKPQVVDVLAKVVRRFDIVAVQEVRAKSDSVIPQFLSAINADGSRYQFVIGPRLGRTVSKEQYTFIYDSTRIEIDPSSVGTSPNPGDRLHRPPMHARFRVRANPPESGFSFWLVDTHTDPDEVALEVNALAEVFQEMKALRPDEDDVILLGDFNAGPPQFGKIKQIPGIGWAVSGVTTNTRRSKTYDNLIFDQRTTTEYTGKWGVLDLQSTFGLSIDKALEVSDHNPVWASFRPRETQLTAGVPAASGLTQ